MANTYTLGSKQLNTSQMANVAKQLKDRMAKGTITKQQYDTARKQMEKSVSGNKVTPTVIKKDTIKPVTPTEIKVEIPVEPNTTYTGSMGDVAVSNTTEAAQLESVMEANKKSAEEAAKKKADIEMEIAKEKQKVIGERDAEKLTRLEAQEKKLKEIEDKYTVNSEQRRQDADGVFKRQEQIATREAGIAAAQAGESGMQLTAGALEDIRGEVIGKYGQNLLNADQFRMQTNLTLDEALKNTGLDIFSRQGEIDKFKGALSDEKFTPVLNALTKAAEGNVQAINDVKDFYAKYQGLKADEDYQKFAIQDRIAAQERTWKGAAPAQRLAILREQFKEDGIMDVFIGAEEKFTNKTYAEAMDLVMKDKNAQDIMKTTVSTAIANGVHDKLPEIYKDYAVKIGLFGVDRLPAVNRTAESKKDKIVTDPDMINKTGGTDTITITNEYKFKDTSKSLLDRAKKSGKVKEAISLLDKGLKDKKISQKLYDASIKYLNS